MYRNTALPLHQCITMNFPDVENSSQQSPSAWRRYRDNTITINEGNIGRYNKFPPPQSDREVVVGRQVVTVERDQQRQNSGSKAQVGRYGQARYGESENLQKCMHLQQTNITATTNHIAGQCM